LIRFPQVIAVKEGNELASGDGQCPVPRRSDARVGLPKQHRSSIAIFFYNGVRAIARAVVHYIKRVKVLLRKG
jgi:hypothetical protein